MPTYSITWRHNINGPSQQFRSDPIQQFSSFKLFKGRKTEIRQLMLDNGMGTEEEIDAALNLFIDQYGPAALFQALHDARLDLSQIIKWV